MNDYTEFTESDRRRMARIESRLVQLMMHLGMDPYAKYYNNPSHLDNQSTRPDTQGHSQTEDRPKSLFEKFGRLSRFNSGA